MEGMLQSLNSVDLTKARGDDEINDLARKLAQGAMPVRVRVTDVKSLEGSAAVAADARADAPPVRVWVRDEWEGVQDESSADGDAASSKPTKVCSSSDVRRCGAVGRLGGEPQVGQEAAATAISRRGCPHRAEA